MVSAVHTNKVINVSGQMTPTKEISRLQRDLVHKEKEMEDMTQRLYETNLEKARIESEKARIESEKARIESENMKIKTSYEQEIDQLRRLLEAANRRLLNEVQEEWSVTGPTGGDDSDDTELSKV